MAWEKVSTLLKSHLAQNQVITVSEFLSTLQLTALLLKSFRLRLHCYTLATGLNHVTHMNHSCHTYDWETSHMWMSHVTYISAHDLCCSCNRSESCHTCESVMLHAWLSHVTHVNEPCHTHKCTRLVLQLQPIRVTSRIWTSHVAHINESCHTCEWVTSHTWVHKTCVAVATDSCCSCNRSDTSRMGMSHVTHMTESCHTCVWVAPHTWVSHVTPTNTSRHTHLSCHVIYM